MKYGRVLDDIYANDYGMGNGGSRVGLIWS